MVVSLVLNFQMIVCLVLQVNFVLSKASQPLMACVIQATIVNQALRSQTQLMESLVMFAREVASVSTDPKE